MPEVSSSARCPSRTADTGNDERRRLTLVTGGGLFVLAIAVLLLRFHRLSELPAGIDAGEGANGVDALRVLQGEHAVFFPEKERGREGMVVYAMALAVYLLGRTELALHLPTALASAGTVFVVFWLGRTLFGQEEESGRATPWRGLLIGGAGAGLLAVSLGQTIIGRTAFRTTFLPLFLCLCLALLWEGWTRRSRWRVALAGVCAGLLPYTYIPARFTPFLFLLFGLSFVLPLMRGKDGGARGVRFVVTSRVRAELPWIGLFVGVAGLVAAPILLHFALHPEDFFSRSNRLSIFDPTLSAGDTLGALLRNVWHHLLAFGFRGDPFWRHNFAEQPMLNPWETFFFWLGVGMAVWKWQRPAYRLLLLWLSVLLVPAMLSTDPGGLVPNTLRMIGAVPAVYLLIGVGMWEAYRFLSGRRLAMPRRAEFTLPGNGTVAAAAVGAVVGCLILVQGIATYRSYFEDWAAAPQTYVAYDQEWTELARALNAQPSAVGVVYLIPYPRPEEPYGFHYLYQGTSPVHLIPETTAHNLVRQIGSTLAATEIVSAVKVVDWNNDLIGGDSDLDERIVAIMGKYGHYLGSEVGSSFRIHTYSDIALDRSWTLYEHLEPLIVHYDGGISLVGIALGQGAEYLSSTQTFTLRDDQPLWKVFQWQVAPGLEIEYSISLRLHDAEGGVVLQKDAVLTNGNSWSTKHWSPDERVNTLHLLHFPADLVPGEYELRLVVYDFESLKPTVEIGVWEPETVLARLQLSEVQ